MPRVVPALSPFLAVAALCLAAPAHAAPPTPEAPPPKSDAPPPTDIFLTHYKIEKGLIHPGTAVNVTRRPGYDNQPSFTANGDNLYYSSIDSTGQADIYLINLPTGHSTRITDTPESEYSPQVVPDSTGISMVRVMADGTQRLWLASFDGTMQHPLLTAAADIGYYAWAGRDSLALFVLGDPPSLAVARAGDDHVTTVMPDVGRSFQRIPGGNQVSFPARSPSGSYVITALDAGTLGTEQIADSLPLSLDHAWVDQNILLMAYQQTLFQWTLGSPGWGQIVTFPDLPGSITRIAVSPVTHRIALVVDESK